MDCGIGIVWLLNSASDSLKLGTIPTSCPTKMLILTASPLDDKHWRKRPVWISCWHVCLMWPLANIRVTIWLEKIILQRKRALCYIHLCTLYVGFTV